MRTLRAALLASLLLAGSALPQEKDAPRQPEQTAIVPGLEVFLDRDGEVVPGPAVDVDARERYISIRARTAKWVGKDKVEITDWKLDRVEWVCVTVGAIPVKTTQDLDPANASLIVGLPDSGEGLLLYACATLVRDGMSGSKERTMTRHALLTVRVTGKAPSTARAGMPAPLENPVAVPAGVSGLAVVIVSREAPPQELVDLAKSERVKTELAKSKSELWVYGPEKFTGPKARNDLLAVLKDQSGRDIPGPGLVVIAGEGKQVLPAGRGQRLVYLKYDGKNDKDSLARNEVILLDSVGRAAGGK